MMRILIRLLAALTLMSLALPAAAQDKVRLLLDWFVNPDHAALVIAKQRGIFTKHGLRWCASAYWSPSRSTRWSRSRTGR